MATGNSDEVHGKEWDGTTDEAQYRAGVEQAGKLLPAKAVKEGRMTPEGASEAFEKVAKRIGINNFARLPQQAPAAPHSVTGGFSSALHGAENEMSSAYHSVTNGLSNFALEHPGWAKTGADVGKAAAVTAAAAAAAAAAAIPVPVG